jgi:catechol-2,3-dioxygenase
VAEAVYFHDPAGNIVELIARKRLNLQHRPVFDAKSWIEISEVGLAADDPAGVREAMTGQMGLAAFWCPSPAFCALGDEHGLFIVVDAHEKKWIPSMEAARSFPLEVDLIQEGKQWHVRWDNVQLELQD